MIHQPHVSGLGGQASDIEIHAREILRTREDINIILAKHTGKPLEVVAEDTERDYWLGAEEGIEYGVLDSILSDRQLEVVTD
jgi:ATP-dependent Clp protease protease subunit